MNTCGETRRDFLRNALITAAALPLLANCNSRTFAGSSHSDILEKLKRNANNNPSINWTGAIDVPHNVSWKTVLSDETDKGEPLEIAGTVFETDGKTPAPNTLIYLYHTDFQGYYGRNGQHRHGRYRGWMLTDKHGNYSFRTIKAAPYPENKWAAHIHMTVTTERHREDWIDSILFDGDRLINARERQEAGQRGGFQPILSLLKGNDGVLRGTRNIQLVTV